MSEKHELPSESDEDDEDYIPEKGLDTGSDIESEIDSDTLQDNDDENDNSFSENLKHKKRKTNKAGGKRKKKRDSSVKREEVKEECEDTKVLTEEEEKKKADSLWADFLKDTETSKTINSKSLNNIESTSSEKLKNNGVKSKTEEKVKITKIYEFAGEKIKVEKEILGDSTEAKLSIPQKDTFTRNLSVSTSENKREGKSRGLRRTGGISSVLGKLGKKEKISTLEKSKLDWDNFKKEENIEEEINTHNRGKDGYLERQDFLQRTDLRQFEIEKQLRHSSRRSNR